MKRLTCTMLVLGCVWFASSAAQAQNDGRFLDFSLFSPTHISQSSGSGYYGSSYAHVPTVSAYTSSHGGGYGCYPNLAVAHPAPRPRPRPYYTGHGNVSYPSAPAACYPQYQQYPQYSQPSYCPAPAPPTVTVCTTVRPRPHHWGGHSNVSVGVSQAPFYGYPSATYVDVCARKRR